MLQNRTHTHSHKHLCPALWHLIQLGSIWEQFFISRRTHKSKKETYQKKVLKNIDGLFHFFWAMVFHFLLRVCATTSRHCSAMCGLGQSDMIIRPLIRPKLERDGKREQRAQESPNLIQLTQRHRLLAKPVCQPHVSSAINLAFPPTPLRTGGVCSWLLRAKWQLLSLPNTYHPPPNGPNPVNVKCGQARPRPGHKSTLPGDSGDPGTRKRSKVLRLPCGRFIGLK